MPAGRPTKYSGTPKELKAVQKMAELGCIDVEFADYLDITRSTYYEWLKEHPEFSDAIKRGKDKADEEIELSLNTLAKGYTRTVQKCIPGIGIVDTEEYFQPNVTAQIFWLKNRKPHQWRDKQTVEMETRQSRPLEISVLVSGDGAKVNNAIKIIEGEAVKVD